MTDNLNIQIKYLLGIPISEYKRKILTGDFDLPDFSDKCPICGAEGCAVFHGFYYRNMENAIRKELVLDVPIARFECHRAYPVLPGSHRTFSLLPDSLIPYLRRDIETVHWIKKLYIQNGCSLTETAGELTIQFGLGEDKYFSTASIWMYVRLFETAQTRYKAWAGKDHWRISPSMNSERKSVVFRGFFSAYLPKDSLDGQDETSPEHCLS